MPFPPSRLGLGESVMRLKKFDVVDFLDSDEALIEYLNVALEENDPRYFAKALGNVARAKGVSSISEATGLGRQSLYRSLSSEGNPRIDTLFRVLNTMNIRLAVTRPTPPRLRGVSGPLPRLRGRVREGGR